MAGSGLGEHAERKYRKKLTVLPVQHIKKGDLLFNSVQKTNFPLTSPLRPSTSPRSEARKSSGQREQEEEKVMTFLCDIFHFLTT